MVLNLLSNSAISLENATKLCRIAEVPEKFIPELSNIIVKDWSNRHTKRTIPELIKKLGTKCSSKYLKDEFINISNIIKKSELEPENKELYAQVIHYKLRGIAVIISDGYDIALAPNLIKDKNGNVVDVRDQDKPRLAYCIPSKNIFNPADPYRGSLQGMGRRKTKKLRRRKVNRNVH